MAICVRCYEDEDDCRCLHDPFKKEKNVMNEWVCPRCMKVTSICVCPKIESKEPLPQAVKDGINKMISKMTVDLKDHANLINEKARLIALAKDLLKGADLVMKRENIVQPFFGIITKHTKTIREFKLDED